MRLQEQLQSYNVEDLKDLIRARGGPGPEGTRKEFLVRYLVESLTNPESLKEVWERLDPLSQKAVAAAFHNGGEFNEAAFVAQYGTRPKRRNPLILFSSRRNTSLLDLFLHYDQIPQELMKLLEALVPPPERFQLQGLAEAPETVSINEHQLPLRRADTEKAGLHDLVAYLRLYHSASISHGKSSNLTPGSVRALLQNLLDGDFWPHEESIKLKDIIRPFGLDVFAFSSGLIRRRGGLSDEGEALLLDGDPEALLHAFENWTEEGSFDELSRVSALKGQKAKRTKLTSPSERREAIIEALSWCPEGVWIDISDFYRAVTIWHFDFELDESDYSGLYFGDPSHGRLDYRGARGWAVARALYINVVLWEYLGSIGVLDLLYLTPEEADLGSDYEDYYSLYDGLYYFRINPLGAYLLGQASEYTPSYPTNDALFSIDPELNFTLKDPDALTPNLRVQLQQFAVEKDHSQYRLDRGQLLNALESGSDFQNIASFIAERNAGPVPKEVTDWLDEIQENLGSFRNTGTALRVKARSPELLRLAEEDPVLRKFITSLGFNALIVPSNKEKAFRERLKELGYLLSQ